MTYEPTWESLDSRPCPEWYDEAKFGIFIHWGLYSVPAWAPKGRYAEWYWSSMSNKESPTWKFHVQNYGEDFKYQDFVAGFRAELFDPEQWAELFANAGARYIVPTSRHHDGFCLWPSPHSWNWNSVDVGPHRDLLGDLTAAVRARSLKMGFYFSLYEWYHPLYLADPSRFAVEHMIPQLKDVISRYEPAILFTDGEWDQPYDVWKSREFLAWLFNESSCRDEIVINDRWGKNTRSAHGGYYTTEYGHVGGDKELAEYHKWEECRGIGSSFGYNRNEDISNYMKPADLIHLLIDTVSKGGNLLLNIGPTADGRIPVIMQERLLEMGKWLEVNGEAIYGTQPWNEAPDDELVRCTRKGDTLYIICLAWPGSDLAVDVSALPSDAKVTMLGVDAPLEWHYLDGELHVDVPPLSIAEMPCQHAHVFKVADVS